jgi:hypothetical protein
MCDFRVDNYNEPGTYSAENDQSLPGRVAGKQGRQSGCWHQRKRLRGSVPDGRRAERRGACTSARNKPCALTNCPDFSSGSYSLNVSHSSFPSGNEKHAIHR